MTLPLEAKKRMLNEIKRQQQEDDKMKKALTFSKSTAIPNDKESNYTNISSQFARVKHVANGEGVIKDNKYQTYAFFGEFLEESMKSQVYMKQMKMKMKMKIMNIAHQIIILMQHLA
jgi:hypothetical protein